MSVRYTAPPERRILDELEDARAEYAHHRTLVTWAMLSLAVGVALLAGSIVLGVSSVGTGVDMGLATALGVLAALPPICGGGATLCHLMFGHDQRRHVVRQLRAAERAHRDHVLGTAEVTQ